MLIKILSPQKSISLVCKCYRKCMTKGIHSFQRPLINLAGESSCVQNFAFSSKASSPVSDQEWDRIYTFPRIRAAAVLQRVKIYQTAALITIGPVTIIGCMNGFIPVSYAQNANIAAVIATVSLFAFTYFFRRLVGHVYINKDKNLVKISHLSYWGRRIDDILPVEDIVPLTDGTCNPTDVYVKIHRYSTEQILLMSLRFGKIHNREDFEQVFGNLEFLYSAKK